MKLRKTLTATGLVLMVLAALAYANRTYLLLHAMAKLLPVLGNNSDQLYPQIIDKEKGAGACRASSA